MKTRSNPVFLALAPPASRRRGVGRGRRNVLTSRSNRQLSPGRQRPQSSLAVIKTTRACLTPPHSAKFGKPAALKTHT
jgi:hypothetical protein